MTDARTVVLVEGASDQHALEALARRLDRDLAAEGVETFVECGPGAALTGMVKRIVPGARLYNVGDPDGVAKAAAALRTAEASV